MFQIKVPVINPVVTQAIVIPAKSKEEAIELAKILDSEGDLFQDFLTIEKSDGLNWEQACISDL